MQILKALLILGCFTFLLSCDESVEAESEPVEPNAQIKIEYAKNFNLIATDSGYELQILDPNTYKLDKKISIAKGKEQKIISLSSTLNGMLSILEGTEHLVGISDINYIFDSKIRAKYKKGKLAEYGDETNYSLEKIISSDANMIMYSGFGMEFPNQKKLEALKVELIPIYDWRENHPLGKAEWIKVIGVVIGKEKEAVAFFDDVKKQYEKIRALALETKHRPSVICGNLIGDVWFTPGGESYFSTLLKDAGANYKYADVLGTFSLEFSIEAILKNNETTEFWLNPGMESKKKIEGFNPHAKHLKAYQNIYCYSPNLNKFWERSASEPNLVLADLIHIFHPEIKEIAEFHFYQKID